MWSEICYEMCRVCQAYVLIKKVRSFLISKFYIDNMCCWDMCHGYTEY